CALPISPEGCEPWDRVCRIMITGANGEVTELFKYITPYAKACSDSVDVTDLVSQLQGKIHLTADFPSKSKITLTLKYHEGEAPAKYSWVKKVWYDQYYSFGNFANQQSVEEKTVELKDTSDFYIHHAYLRIMSSGHNWGDNNTGNAAEFKEATHNIQVDGTTVYTQHLWQTCNPNPAGCNAQSGTWQYNRAGWCPGSIPILWRFDLSSFIHQDVALNYQFDPTYIDYCSSSNPACVTGSTCPDCTDPANPIIDVAADLISYFDVVPVSVEESEIQMEVFPNPSNGVFTIETSVDFVCNAVVTVLDATGKTVMQFSWNGESRILDLTELSEGIYVLKVLNKNGISIKKLIVE
ncbi:MAG: T9SS type A sorting domain-containing protein, partial [Bacteroidales bacterium]